MSLVKQESMSEISVVLLFFFYLSSLKSLCLTYAFCYTVYSISAEHELEQMRIENGLSI